MHKYAAMPFEYGADCCTFVGECLVAMGHRNPMEFFDYNSERQAYRIIKNWGGLKAAVSAFLGEPYDGIKDGDVCLIDDNKGREAVAIVYNGRIVARVENGLMDYPLDRALTVWDVKCPV